MSTRQDKTSDKQAGFTLVEALLTLVLSGMLLAFLYQALFFSTRFLATGSRSAEVSRQTHELAGVLRGELESAYPHITPDPEQGYVTRFEGTSQSIEFLSTYPTKNDVEGIRDVRITVEDAGLLVASALWREGRQETTGARQVLYDGFGATFAFADKVDDGEPEWTVRWTARRDLPALVKVVMTDKRNDDSVQTLIVRPQIIVDSRCVFERLTRRCRGR
ncbi:prepilin-type N-terminal cleavage/methylation domain-containing protein [Pyruvatibacter sp.]|uniref:prepilin-type N-terminal cleavage/methylation domain-containing protein n=1 Tax=Pyruvatibacter sp. TaxID=1981328 RepID=UPI003264CA06